MASSSDEICKVCVLSPAVPGVTLDAEGVCSVCREYERHKATYDAYFRTEADLKTLLEETRKKNQGAYDVLLMYSGGKDSTYVLYKLLDLGVRVLAVTFDNGYIPQGCFTNIKSVCADLGVDSIVTSLDKKTMDAVFAESLRTVSTVCTGCFRGLSARATEIALEKKIPIVMTGFSRGQIFEVKVHPILTRGITDPERVDAMLAMMRSRFHSTPDAIGALIEDNTLPQQPAYRELQFIDYFRYSPVTKQEIIKLITDRAPFWRKPEAVGGCSSNCGINDAGIHVHIKTKGFHNYAVPGAWEIRFGHLTREMALHELTSEIDLKRVNTLLRVIGYRG